MSRKTRSNRPKDGVIEIDEKSINEPLLVGNAIVHASKKDQPMMVDGVKTVPPPSESLQLKYEKMEAANHAMEATNRALQLQLDQKKDVVINSRGRPGPPAPVDMVQRELILKKKKIVIDTMAH